MTDGPTLSDVLARLSAATKARVAAELANGQVVEDEADLIVVTVADEWFEALESTAFHGLAGDFMRLLEPTSEADPAAILLHLLIHVGIIVGSRVRTTVGLDQHPARINGLVIGPTGMVRLTRLRLRRS